MSLVLININSILENRVFNIFWIHELYNADNIGIIIETSTKFNVDDSVSQAGGSCLIASVYLSLVFAASSQRYDFAHHLTKMLIICTLMKSNELVRN